MTNARVPLPIQLQPIEDESGLGFILRVFCANGLSTTCGRRQLGIKNWRSLTLEDVIVLSIITQTPPDWLTLRLMIRSAQFQEHFQYFGHTFRSQAAKPNMSAKICPDCAREKRWCNRTWILPGAVACPFHFRRLIDTCNQCGRTITWRRPAVEICACGRYLSDSNWNPPRVDRNIVSWSKWLDTRLRQPTLTDAAADGLVPRLLNHLTIDGATAVVCAFGIRDHPTSPLNPDDVRNQPCDFLFEVVGRGLARLWSINDRPQDARRWSEYVYAPILERLRRNGVSTSDRNSASLLLSFTASRSHPSNGGRNNRGQLDLFDQR